MQPSPGNDYPQLCFDVGLTCDACVAETARQMAQVCKGLRGKMVGQLFVQLYPNSACAPMHANFAECYRASSVGSELAPEELPMRKPPAKELPMRKPAAIAAVA